MSAADFERAAIATNDAVVFFTRARELLEDRIITNGYGILADPAAVLARISEACDSLGAAIERLNSVEFPTADQYVEEAERLAAERRR